MKKFWMTGLLCITLVLAPLYAFGTGTGVYLETCGADGQELQVICSKPDHEEDELAADAFQLTLEGTLVPITSISSVSEEHIPLTVYCLVDVSGSMRPEQMAQAKETLYAVCRGLNDTDNMVIATLGNQTWSSGFLSDTAQIEEAIEELEAGNEDTNLYAGIVESINTLQSDANVRQKRCLLILSDGQDEQKSGITREEAERAVAAAHIPIYTVATLSSQPGEESIEYGKLLGSFARASAGGVHYTPSVDGISGEEAGRDILENIGGSLLLKAEMPELSSERNELQLRLVYTASDDSRYEDSLTVYAEDLLKSEETLEDDAAEASTEETIEETTESSAEESVAETDTDEESSEPEEDEEDSWDLWNWITSENGWIWIAAGAAVLILVIAVIIVVIRKRRKKVKDSPSTPQESLPDRNHKPVEGIPDGNHKPVEPNPSRQKTQELTLMAIGYQDISHKIQLPEGIEVTIGRNGKADIILDAGDSKLSGAHCVMKWENGRIYVRDMDSKNGTYVNGVPIRQMGTVVIHEGETIRVGSYEYRVKTK